MQRVSVPLFILTLGFGLAFCASGLGQESGDNCSGPKSTLQSEQRPHVLVFGNADEVVLTTSIEYYEPEPGFNRTNRDIDLQAATIGVGAHLRHGWEFQFDGLVLRAHGYRTLPSGAPNPRSEERRVGKEC